MQTKPAQPRTASDPPARPQDGTVAVFGLNAIGRQVTLQLAALGVGRLVLVDPGRVSRRHYAAEGFAAEDVGRPKVQAAAQAAHQLNPLLDIETVVGGGPPSWDAVDAVFCCTAARWARQAGRHALASRIGFYAAADVHDGRIYLAVVCEKPDAVLEEADLLPPWGEVTRRRGAVCPPHVASIASGLVVAEFDRFATGRGENRELHINLETMTFTVTGLA